MGVGVDFSEGMVRAAMVRHPELLFVIADTHELPVKGPFDVIILSDLVNDLWDVQEAFKQLRSISHSHTRLIINSYSRLWELPLAATESLDLARPTLYQNWLTVDDITHLLQLSGFQLIRHWSEILWPLNVPVIEQVLNRFLVKLWPFRFLALTNFMVARPSEVAENEGQKPLVSVVVPARNEAGNIGEIFE